MKKNDEKLVLVDLALIYASRYFLKKPFPENCRELDRDQLLEYVANNLERTEFSPESALDSIYQLGETLISFMLYAKRELN